MQGRSHPVSTARHLFPVSTAKPVIPVGGPARLIGFFDTLKPGSRRGPGDSFRILVTHRDEDPVTLRRDGNDNEHARVGQRNLGHFQRPATRRGSLLPEGAIPRIESANRCSTSPEAGEAAGRASPSWRMLGNGENDLHRSRDLAEPLRLKIASTTSHDFGIRVDPA